jgi:hypothetical protein
LTTNGGWKAPLHVRLVINGDRAMMNLQFWPPRFGLRALLVFVLVVSVALAFLDGWRRTQQARNARAEFERHNAAWKLGVIRPEVIIDASQNLLAAERRQWFSSYFEPAIVDSSILRLTRIRDSWQPFLADLDSEAQRRKDLQLFDDLIRLIDEAEAHNRHDFDETEEH